jgi:branched-chain amino acid transport system substrate-binding protein
MWNGLQTNKVVGALWPNDTEGNSSSDPKTGFPPGFQAAGFKLVDTGRFPPATNDFSGQISAFKNAGVEIVTGVLPPPAFATFWSQCAQQNFRPKAVTVAKSLLFPAAVEAIGDRAKGLSTEVWWSPKHPFKSGLTGQTPAQFCAEYEAATGKQWTQPIGFRHALLEVALDVLGRTTNIDSPAIIRDAMRTTNYNSIVGPVAWHGEPVKNVAKTPLVGGQWASGEKFKYDLLIVNNDTDRNIPADRKMVPL